MPPVPRTAPENSQECTGTGKFITELIEYLPPQPLEYNYAHELHCNEVSILPYYIANLNIENTYKQNFGKPSLLD